MQNSIYKIKYLLFLSWDWEAWCLTVWGVISPPPERNTAWNKGRKCFHCLGAPNNLIRPWLIRNVGTFLRKQHDFTFHKTIPRSKKICKYDVFIVGSMLIRKVWNKLAGNKDIPVKQSFYSRPDAARSEAQQFMCSADRSQCGVPHNGAPATTVYSSCSKERCHYCVHTILWCSNEPKVLATFANLWFLYDEGWRRSVGPIMWEMKKCYLESMSRGISYTK